jgi:(2Fe-2S) ferredoxin
MTKIINSVCGDSTGSVEPTQLTSDVYKYHVFFCLNTRESMNGEPTRQCCGGEAAINAHQHAKHRIKQLGLNKIGQVRINQAGCLERCEQGPCLVIYPQGTWYTYLDNSDIDTIIDTHILNGVVAKQLELSSPIAT